MLGVVTRVSVSALLVVALGGFAGAALLEDRQVQVAAAQTSGPVAGTAGLTAVPAVSKAAAVSVRSGREQSGGSLKQARRVAMRSYVLHAPKVKDTRGVRASAYKGRFYTAQADRARRCILMRESHGNYEAVSASGTYRGGYQLSPELAVGATWMMLKEHKRLLGPAWAKKKLAKLRSKPANTWNRYWQDAAFFAVYNASRPAGGAQHWHLAGSSC